MPIKTYSGPPVTILVRVPKQAKQCNNLRRRVNRSRFVRAPLAAQQVLAAAAPVAPLPALRKIPGSLSEIDNGKILGFGADLAADHPGFGDEPYKRRRVSIAELARDHQVGSPIPCIEYTAEEVQTWGTVLQELTQLYPQHACQEYLRNFSLFNFKESEVPQLEDMSRILKDTTGWQIRPVAGLLHPRDFLNGLAFSTFHSTQYVRHHSKPMYTPEPDVCHELLGHVPMLADPSYCHVPMLADPSYCDLVQNIGVASLGADEKQIWHLTKLYWFTVEFGVVREGDQVKGFGAGVLSSYGELQHMASGMPKLVDFDPFAAQPKMSYKDGYQKQYFVLNSFKEGAKQLLDYCLSITDPDVVTQHLQNLNRSKSSS
ncbi:hypothetical protein WJX82_011490 [Trebouxia sp. C0006]